MVFFFLVSPSTENTTDYSRLFVAVLLYPFLEEIVFRGAIQGAIANIYRKDVFFGISAANIATSVLFSGLHFFHHPMLWSIAVFVPSICFGYFREKYNHLVSPIILHMFYNSGYFLLL